jgi:hypothetical protein
MNKESLLKPMEVRFTEPADIERYGADWHTYDELAIVTQPAKVLVPLELEIGAPLVVAMDGFRESSVYGDSVAAWLALHFVEPGKAPAAVSDPADSSPSADTQPSMDTVVLPSMPVGG